MTTRLIPTPLTQEEYIEMKQGAMLELNHFLLESALVSDWWNPTEDDKAQWKHIISLDIDGFLMRKFLLDLGRFQGKNPHRFFFQTLTAAWPNKADYKNTKRRTKLELRYNKWGVEQ